MSKNTLLIAIGVLLLIVASAAFTFYLPLIVGSRPIQNPYPDQQGPGYEIAIIASPHIPFVTATHVAYDSNPPTSGPHVPWTIAPGIYTEPIPDTVQVHALEHGHIVIQYAVHALKSSDLQLLTKIAARYPDVVVLAPRPAMRANVAITAWGRLDTLQSIRSAEIEMFIKCFAGRYDHRWQNTHC